MCRAADARRSGRTAVARCCALRLLGRALGPACEALYRSVGRFYFYMYFLTRQCLVGVEAIGAAAADEAAAAVAAAAGAAGHTTHGVHLHTLGVGPPKAPEVKVWAALKYQGVHLIKVFPRCGASSLTLGNPTAKHVPTSRDFNPVLVTYSSRKETDELWTVSEYRHHTAVHRLHMSQGPITKQVRCTAMWC